MKLYKSTFHHTRVSLWDSLALFSLLTTTTLGLWTAFTVYYTSADYCSCPSLLLEGFDAVDSSVNFWRWYRMSRVHLWQRHSLESRSHIMTKHADKKRVAKILRFAVLSAFISGALVILLGSGLNNLNHKYSRVSAPGVRSCKRELFITNVPDSRLCCDTPHNSVDWICVASYDFLNKLFSSKWAFQIPLIPFVITVVTECTEPTSSRLSSHSSRLIFYFCLILFRTVRTAAAVSSIFRRIIISIFTDI